MANITLCSYDMKGKKEEFADWISNISPKDTPFLAMIAKEGTTNTIFQWESDELRDPSALNSFEQGSDAEAPQLEAVTINSNYTQIFRKTVMTSDTSEAVDSYGRGDELQYQLTKAASELQRDLEKTLLLTDQAPVLGTTVDAQKTRSLGDFIDANHKADFVTSDFEDQLFSLTLRLYIDGSVPEVILYHPALAKHFSQLAVKLNDRKRVFTDTSADFEVKEVIDPLGQKMVCIPCRQMPEKVMYLFNPKDIQLLNLRNPESFILGKTGSGTKYMIEQEAGLRLDNVHTMAMLTSKE